MKFVEDFLTFAFGAILSDMLSRYSMMTPCADLMGFEKAVYNLSKAY